MIFTREGRPEDFEAASGLITEFYNESISTFGIDIDKISISKAIKECADNSLVLTVDDTLAGIIAGKIVEIPLQQTKVFQEYIWFISKNYRRYGIRLLNAMEKKCRDLGLSHIIMMQMSNSKSGQLDSFYKRQGYKEFEIQYIKTL